MIVTVELQKALYQALSDEYDVYDVRPKEPNFPFISFGDMSRVEDFTKTDQDRYVLSVLIHGWSKGFSSLQSKQLEHYITNKLKNIQVNGFDVELSSLVYSTTLREDSTTNETIFHSVQEFSLTINTK